MHILRIVLLTVFFACASFAQSVTLTNNSSWRSYPTFLVGDPFSLTVSGAAYTSVTMDAQRAGDPTPYNWNLGTTDGYGNLVVSDSMGSWNVGDWTETVYVGSAQASPTLEFSVEEPEPCSFSPYGTGNFWPMYSEDWWDSGTRNASMFAGPEQETHEVLSGPCGAVYGYSTGPIDAEYELDDYDYVEGGYKKVDWTIEDTGAGWGRCDPQANFNCWYNYPIYDQGDVQTQFQHRDTHEDFWRTSRYTLEVGRACLLGYCYP